MRAINDANIQYRYQDIKPFLNEQQKRLWAATEAKAIGYGGVSCLARAIGMDHKTIRLGLKEIESLPKINLSPLPIRKKGGARKSVTQHVPELKSQIEALIEPFKRGDPESPLLWTCKSTSKLANELTKKGYDICPRTVSKLLKEMGYSLQANRKSLEGSQHPDRDAQFRYIAKATRAFQCRNSPVISVDTKKKELIGAYKNCGKEWHEKGKAPRVNTYDFPDEELGKAIPYGVFDVENNEGWVSVGSDHDTAEFAVESIRRWWVEMGEARYPKARELLIMADGGGSNGSRNRLWKYMLSKFAREEDLKSMVCHFPPGTSKWNKIEHGMFSYISKNWRGRPLTSHEVVVNLIAKTQTKKGLRIEAETDHKTYVTGKKVSDEDMENLHMEKADFHGEWNYVISP